MAALWSISNCMGHYPLPLLGDPSILYLLWGSQMSYLPDIVDEPQVRKYVMYLEDRRPLLHFPFTPGYPFACHLRYLYLINCQLIDDPFGFPQQFVCPAFSIPPFLWPFGDHLTHSNSTRHSPVEINKWTVQNWSGNGMGWVPDVDSVVHFWATEQLGARRLHTHEYWNNQGVYKGNGGYVQ